jgi:hypothetical protein
LVDARHGRNVLIDYLQPEAVGIKNTKTASVSVPGCRGNTNQGRKGFDFDTPPVIVFGAPGMDPVNSTGVSMSGETQVAFSLQHEGKMPPKLLLSMVKTFHKA